MCAASDKKHSLLLAGLLLFTCNTNFAQPANTLYVNPKLTTNSIINLYDAFGKREDLFKDFGFASIINYQGKIILFDAGGHADKFAKNVKKLGVDLKKIDMVVISHAHPDHLNGLDYLLTIHPKVKIYFPEDILSGTPAVFDATGADSTVIDSLPPEMRYYKMKDRVVQSGRFWRANIEYVKQSKELLPGLKLVTTASPYLGYFSRYPKTSIAGRFNDSLAGAGNRDVPRLVGLNELSLSMATVNGEVVLVGCSHSSVEKIVEAVKRYTQKDIALVMGGFHMIPFGREEIASIANYLKNELQVKKVAPAHCTGHLAFKVFRDLFGAAYIYAGAGEKIEF